jgi:hypothetical protein
MAAYANTPNPGGQAEGLGLPPDSSRMKDAPACVDDGSLMDDGLFYRLFAEAEGVRWKMSDYDWSSVDVSDVSPSWVEVARETLYGELTTFSATERFFADFGEDVDFTQWLTVWLYEETKHPTAILRWLDLFGEKFNSHQMRQGRVSLPFMPERMGTLAANVVSEMVAATLYTTLSSQPTIEPLLGKICRNIAGDEARHASSFYCYAKKRLSRCPQPEQETLEALKVLHFWVNPELNNRVGHPVNLLVHRFQSRPSIQEAVPREVLGSAVAATHKRAVRVFGTLYGLDLRDAKDVEDCLAGRGGRAVTPPGVSATTRG